jgi:hypothetical protein
MICDARLVPSIVGSSVYNNWRCIKMLKEFGFCNGGNKESKVGSRPVLIQAGGKGVICPVK